MQGKNTKECGIKIHTYIHISPLFSLVPRKKETLSAAASRDRPARNDSKTRNCRSSGKTTGKVGFEGCRFFPKRGQTGMCQPGAQGAETRAVPTRASPRCACSPAAPSRDSRGHPSTCHQRHWGSHGQGVRIFPSCPLEKKDAFLSC